MADGPPNILLIMTDQFRFDCMGCMGHAVVRTPHLDALAASATLFTAAYTPTMPCAPARASILTGRYPDSHGLGAGLGTLNPPDIPAFPEHLHAHGYETALVGKLHLKPFERQYGFDHFVRNDYLYTNYDEHAGRGSAYIQALAQAGMPDALERFTADEACYETDELRFMLGSNFIDEPHHHTTWTADETIAFLEQDHTRPFLLNCSFYGPHQPYLCPGPWGSMYRPDEIALPDDFASRTEDKPIFRHSWLGASLRARRKRGWDEGVYRRILSAYYGNISMIDHHVGRVLDALRARGLFENTLIVFTADHGDYAGQFRSFYKSLPYEGATHVPLIIRDPRAPGPRVVRPNVSTIDLFATLLSQAGAPRPECESRDLSRLIAGDASGWDDVAYWKDNAQSMLVRHHYKIMRAPVGQGVVYEFYDLREQPMEGINRFIDPGLQRRIRTLRAELDKWHADQEARGKCRC